MGRRIILGAAVCACVLMGAAAAAMTAGVSSAPAQTADVPETAAVSAVTGTAGEERYFLRLEGDHIEVYSQNGTNRPVMRVEIDAVSLREGDRQLLSRGISADGYEEALRLLEDFNS